GRGSARDCGGEATIDGACVTPGVRREPERQPEKRFAFVVVPSGEPRRQRGEDIALLGLAREGDTELRPEREVRRGEQVERSARELVPEGHPAFEPVLPESGPGFRRARGGAERDGGRGLGEAIARGANRGVRGGAERRGAGIRGRDGGINPSAHRQPKIACA